jgi:hypothetical protein
MGTYVLDMPLCEFVAHWHDMIPRLYEDYSNHRTKLSLFLVNFEPFVRVLFFQGDEIDPDVRTYIDLRQFVADPEQVTAQLASNPQIASTRATEHEILEQVTAQLASNPQIASTHDAYHVMPEQVTTGQIMLKHVIYGYIAAMACVIALLNAVFTGEY